MENRQLGKDGPYLSAIGFGTWATGGAWQYGWGKQDDQDSIAAIHKAIECGVNWIDTAAVYGLGHSEKIVRAALQGISEEIFVATKCGLAWNEKGETRIDIRPESIRKEIDQSLERLGVDIIDLYQIHWPHPKLPAEDAWSELVKLKESGKVRYIGVSNFGLDDLSKCNAIHPVQSLQPPYSVINRVYEAKVLSYCMENGIGVVVYGPMHSGLLTGKFDVSRLAEDDWRRNSPEHTEPKLSKYLELVDKLRPIAEKYGKTIGQLAIAWTLMNPAVTSAIVGARNARQQSENIEGAGWRISQEDMEEIESLHSRILGGNIS